MATNSIIDINKIVNEIKNATSRIRKGEENIRENIEFILRSEVYNKLSQTEKEGLQIQLHFSKPDIIVYLRLLDF